MHHHAQIMQVKIDTIIQIKRRWQYLKMKILFTNVASKLNLLTPEDIVKQNIMPGLQETGVRVICQ